MRKHLVDYDDVINTQRDIIYTERSKVLSGINIKENILEMVEKEVSQIVNSYIFGLSRDEWQLENMLKDISSILPLDSNIKDASFMNNMTPDGIDDYFVTYLNQGYEARESRMSSQLTRKIEQQLMLRFIDVNWVQHLTSMEQIRQGTGLYAFGQRDPLVMYKKQARDQFESLLSQIQHDIARSIFHIDFTSQPSLGNKNDKTPGARLNAKGSIGGKNQNTKLTSKSSVGSIGKQKIGRNESCPCGSGKKYKKCHAQLDLS